MTGTTIKTAQRRIQPARHKVKNGYCVAALLKACLPIADRLIVTKTIPPSGTAVWDYVPFVAFKIASALSNLTMRRRLRIVIEASPREGLLQFPR